MNSPHTRPLQPARTLFIRRISVTVWPPAEKKNPAQHHRLEIRRVCQQMRAPQNDLSRKCSPCFEFKLNQIKSNAVYGRKKRPKKTEIGPESLSEINKMDL